MHPTDHADVEETVVPDGFVDADRNRGQNVFRSEKSRMQARGRIEMPDARQVFKLVAGGGSQAEDGRDFMKVAIVGQAHGWMPKSLRRHQCGKHQEQNPINSRAARRHS